MTQRTSILPRDSFSSLNRRNEKEHAFHCASLFLWFNFLTPLPVGEASTSEDCLQRSRHSPTSQTPKNEIQGDRLPIIQTTLNKFVFRQEKAFF